MGKALVACRVREESRSSDSANLQRSEGNTLTFLPSKALAETRKKIESLNDDDLVSGFKAKLIEHLRTTVELSCYIAELNRRGMDLSMLDKNRLNRYLAIAYGQLNPDLYDTFAHTSWMKIIEQYDPESQRRVATEPIRVLTSDGGSEELPVSKMDDRQRKLVLGPTGPRSLESQRQIADQDEFRLPCGSVHTALMAIGRVESIVCELNDADREAVLESVLNLAKTLGFEPDRKTPTSIAHPEEHGQIRKYVEKYGAARARVIAADLGITQSRVMKIIESDQFVHNGDGYYALRDGVKKRKGSSASSI